MLPIVYTSNDTRAPVLNNAAGSLLGVLDACLVTGFNLCGIHTLIVASNVVTATTSNDHGYLVGQCVTISGANTPALNGVKTILATPTAVTFTFAAITADTHETPPSCQARRTPLGWIKAFTGTHRAIYRMSDPTSYGQLLRVVDNEGAEAQVFGVETATGIDTFGSRFPTSSQTSNNNTWFKGENNTTAKFWAIVGDDRFFYLITEDSHLLHSHTVDSFGYFVGFFGDIISFKPGEAFGCSIGLHIDSHLSAVTGHQNLGMPPSAGDFFICRQHTGIAKSIQAGLVQPGGGSSSSNDYPPYPSAVDNGLVFLEPSLIVEALPSAGNPIRGIMPGVVQALCRNIDLLPLNGQIIQATDGSGLRAMVFTNIAHRTNALVLKLSEPWR